MGGTLGSYPAWKECLHEYWEYKKGKPLCRICAKNLIMTKCHNNGAKYDECPSCWEEPRTETEKKDKMTGSLSMYEKGQADWVFQNYGHPEGDLTRHMAWFEENEGTGYSCQFIFRADEGYIMYKWDTDSKCDIGLPDNKQ